MSTRALKSAVAILLLLVLVSGAEAQRRGFGMMRAAPMRPMVSPALVRPAVPHVATPRTTGVPGRFPGRPATTLATPVTGLPPGAMIGSFRTIPGLTPGQAYANSLLASSVANPFFFRNPFLFGNPYYNPYLYNPYLYNPYVYSGYGYGSLGYGGYGGAFGDANAYGLSPYGDGNGYGFSNPYVNPYVVNPYVSGVPAGQPSGYGSTGVATPAAVLAAAGVPASGDKLEWPLILRILPGADPLRQRIEAVFQIGASQAATGTLSSGTPLEMYRAVEKLESLLARDKHERLTFSSDMYGQAERFLRRLKAAARTIQAVARAGSSTSAAPSP